MAAMAMTHTTHAVKGSPTGLNAWSMTDTLHRARVALAITSGALAVKAAAFAVSAFRMNALTVRVLGMQRGLV